MDEKETIIKSLLDEQSKEIKRYIDERVGNVETTLAPIAAIYNSTQGFNSVLKFIFKSMVIPLSVVIGIVLSIKKLLLGHPFP